MTKNEYRKGVCQCRKCGSVFHQSDVKKVQTKRYGLEIEEKVSPCCKHTYGLVDYPVDEFDLLYKKDYHRNTNKKLKSNLNKITNEIIKEDMQKYKERMVIKSINTERLAMAQ